MIESVNNEKIKNYAKLQLKKYRDSEGMFIVEGEHLVEEAAKNGLLIDAFSLDGSMGMQVSISVMKKLSSLKNVPNVLGIAKKREESTDLGNILVLDNLQDPGNLGTIIRSAVAFGIDTIVASEETVDVYNTKTLRSSEGMFFHINYLIRDLDDFLPSLKEYTIYTTNVNNGKNIKEITPEFPYAIIMGNEGNGVRKNISEYANETLYIPINANCESLNVAIATSIILYEWNTKK